MEEEEEIWFNEDEDFDVVPTNKPEMDPAYKLNANNGKYFSFFFTWYVWIYLIFFMYTFVI